MLSVRASVVILLVVVPYMHHASAATAIELSAKKPARLADTPGCYSPAHDAVLPYGETYPEGQCEKYFCAEVGHIDVVTCSAVTGPLDEGCRLAKNLKLRYPECCTKIECDEKE